MSRTTLRVIQGAVLAAAMLLPGGAALAEIGEVKAREAAAALVRGDADAAVPLYTEALRDPSLSNARRAVIVNDRAVAYARIGQTKLAVEDYNRAVQLFPEYAATYNNRGSLLMQVGLVKEAVKDFDRALLLAPGYAAAYNNRGVAQLGLGNTDAAIADFTKAIELMPAAPAPLGGRGRALLANGRPHAAIRDFTRAIRADTRFAGAYRSRAEAKLLVERTEEAAEDLSRAIAFDAGNVQLYMLRGQAYLGARNLPAALKDFARALELEPGSVAALQARGLAYALSDAAEDALADLDRAVEMDPRSAVAYAYRGYAYKRSGQPEIGLKDVLTAAKLDADRPEVLWARAEVESELGRADQAIRDLRRALELRPGYREAIDLLQRLGAAPVDTTQETSHPELGIDGWRVVARRGRYFAAHEKLPRLRVPLEMAGAGKPYILEWEERSGPLKGIGVLRFFAGQVEGKSGPEEVEQAAIVDLTTSSVVAIEPHRQGQKVATWTWDEGKVVVASVDGVTDEFILRNVKRRDELAASQQAQQRRTAERRVEGPAWAPWASGPTFAPSGGSGSGGGSRPKPKPKTLFDLLFN